MNKVSRTFKIANVKFLSVEGELDETFINTTEQKIRSYAKSMITLSKKLRGLRKSV